MTDVFTKKKRSEIMSKIRSKNTKVELLFRKRLWSEGLRYRVYSNILPGKPDIVFSRYKLAVFVDGCFWHRCPICFTKPQTNKKYWEQKIRYNVAKDKKINHLLKQMGWKVLRFWEHEIKKYPDLCLKRIKRSLIRDYG